MHKWSEHIRTINLSAAYATNLCKNYHLTVSDCRLSGVGEFMCGTKDYLLHTRRTSNGCGGFDTELSGQKMSNGALLKISK